MPLNQSFPPQADGRPVLANETSAADASSLKPSISVIIMNYNGAPWLERCLDSIRRQTLFDEIEVIVGDNASPDQSGRLAAEITRDWPHTRVLQFDTNLGYSGGHNCAAKQAGGDFLLFLNNDTWLEPDCLEHLLQDMKTAGAMAATPLVMDYVSDRMQSVGESGFDIFGLACGPIIWSHRREIFIATGPALIVERNLFETLGGFDGEFFMYAEEYDLCWRVWSSGYKVILALSARAHHRGAPDVNPRGSQEVLEIRTSDTKRFYANRNNLLVLLKNSQHLLLALVPLQLLMLSAENLVVGLLLRRWTYVQRSLIEPVRDCWRLRRHILAERRRLRALRKHGDFWMLRFLRPQLNRGRELRRFMRFGFPKVDPK